LQAVFSAVWHFRFLLEGRHFRLLTDHKPLVAAMACVTPPWSARQQRQMAYLSEFTSYFRHTSSTANVVADALSHPPLQVSDLHPTADPQSAAGPHFSKPLVSADPHPAADAHSFSVPHADSGPPAAADLAVVASLPSGADQVAAASSGVDFAAMAEAQRHCPDIVSMRASPSIQVICRLVGDVHLLGDISTGVFRPFVPAAFRAAVIRSIHDIHHPEIRATTRLVSS
jgi:hypothetical protein